jgi:hypothetical protein
MAIAGIALLLLPGWTAGVAGWLLLAAAAAPALVAQGGRIALERQHRIHAAQPDLFLELNRRRSEGAVLSGEVPPVGAVRRWVARRLLGHGFLVGDTVRIKPYNQIRATLDADGRLEGLSFMDEMRAYCGRSARVYRVLDKIYDYGRSREMRRLDRGVLLVGLRCDGQGHGGCDAACYMVWKEAWLDTASHGERFAPSPVLQQQEGRAPPEPGKLFNCQYTELTKASQPGIAGRLRGFLEPWIVGNVSGAAWWVVVLTRVFNALQEWRGGATYPARPASGGQTSKPAEPVRRGDWVRVRTPAEIAETLDAKGNHRGLWFDRDMLKHCGQSYRVLGRVQRIVDIRSTAMIPMKTACIVLEDVHFSGEFQWFGEQHDYLYWREAWLQPIAQPPAEI